MSRPGIPALLVILGLLLLSVWALTATDHVRLGGPGGSRLGPEPFAVILGGFFATALACTFWPARRTWILLGSSALLLPLLHGPLGAAVAVAAYALFHLVLGWKIPWALKTPLVALPFLAPLLAAWLAPGTALFPTALVILTATNFTYRGILYAYEVTAKRKILGETGLKDFLLGLTAFPFATVQSPPVGFIALKGKLGAQASPDLMARGIGQMALGFLYLVILRAGRLHGFLPDHLSVMQRVESLDALSLPAISLTVLTGLFLDLIGHVHVSIGMARVLGWDIPSGSGKPLLSPSLAEYWRRWNTYYRDWLMTIAFYPTAFFFKKHRTIAIVVAGAATFVLSGFMHFLADFLASPGPVNLRRFLEPQANLLVIGALVIASLVLELRRPRKAGASPRPASSKSGLRAALGVAWTLLVTSLAYTLFRRPFSGNLSESLEALTRAPW